MKIVVVIVAVLLLVWLLLGSSRRRAKEARHDRAPTARRSGKPAQVEGMVACAHCGVHLPGSLALRQGEQVFCSPAHRDAGARSAGDG